MKRILRIDTSTRGANSHSIDLANMIEVKLKENYQDVEIISRDLSKTNIPHLSQEHIEATFVPSEDRTSVMNDILLLANELIAEIKSADTVLISVPMFNFNIPSSLKAYIDNISRPGETFSIGESGYTGLLTGKKLVILAAYGADFTQMKAMDFVEPYLKSVFGFLGFEDISYYALEGTSMLSSEMLTDKKQEIAQSFHI